MSDRFDEIVEEIAYRGGSLREFAQALRDERERCAQTAYDAAFTLNLQEEAEAIAAAIRELADD